MVFKRTTFFGENRRKLLPQHRPQNDDETGHNGFKQAFKARLDKNSGTRFVHAGNSYLHQRFESLAQIIFFRDFCSNNIFP
jgi:hypothetical protein